MPNKHMESYTLTMSLRDPHSTHGHLNFNWLEEGGTLHTHTLENFGLDCST